MNRFRKLAVMCACVVALVVVIAVHAEFARKVSITGGSPAPRVFDSLTTAGYTAGSQLDELTIKNPSANTNSFYLGSSSSVNASTGFELTPGMSITYRSGARAIDSSRLFLYVVTTQNAEITLRER